MFLIIFAILIRLFFAKEIFVTFDRQSCDQNQLQCDGSEENPYSSIGFAIFTGVQISNSNNDLVLSIRIEAGPHLIFEEEANLVNSLDQFSGSVSFSVYEGPCNPLEAQDISLKGKAFISLRTQSVVFVIRNSLEIINVIFEGRSSHMSDHLECIYTFSGCCQSVSELLQNDHICFIDKKFSNRVPSSSGSEQALFIFRGVNSIFQMENVSFIGLVGVEYSNLMVMGSEAKGIQGIFKFLYFEEIFFSEGLVKIVKETDPQQSSIVLMFAGVLITRYNPCILANYLNNLRQKTVIFDFRQIVSENIVFRGIQISQSPYIDYIFSLKNVSSIQVFDASFSNFIVFSLSDSSFSLNNTAFSTENVYTTPLTNPDLETKLKEILQENFELSNLLKNSQISCSFCFFIFDKDPNISEIKLFKAYDQNSLTVSYSLMLFQKLPRTFCQVLGAQNTVNIIGNMIVYPGDLFVIQNTMNAQINLMFTVIQAFQSNFQTLFTLDYPCQKMTLYVKGSRIDGMLDVGIVHIAYSVDSIFIFEDSIIRNLYYTNSILMFLYYQTILNTLIIRRTEIFNVNSYLLAGFIQTAICGSVTMILDSSTIELQYSSNNGMLFTEGRYAIHMTNTTFRNYSGYSGAFILCYDSFEFIMVNSSIVDSLPADGSENRNFFVGPFLKVFMDANLTFDRVLYRDMYTISDGSLCILKNSRVSFTRLTVIRASGDYSLITIQGDSDIYMNDTVVLNCKSKVFIQNWRNHTSIKIENAKFENFTTKAIWGNFFFDTKLNISNATFQNFDTNSDVSVMFFQDNGQAVYITNASFTNIRSSGVSGILSLIKSKIFTIENSNFAAISAPYSSIAGGSETIIIMRATSIFNVSSTYRGGAFDLKDSKVDILDSVLKEISSSTYGCGILTNVSLRVSNVLIERVTSLRSGPVLFISGSFMGENITVKTSGKASLQSYLLSVDGNTDFSIVEGLFELNNFKSLLFVRGAFNFVLMNCRVKNSSGTFLDLASVAGVASVNNLTIEKSKTTNSFLITLENTKIVKIYSIRFSENSLNAENKVFDLDPPYGLLEIKSGLKINLEVLNITDNYKQLSATLISINNVSYVNLKNIFAIGSELICVRAIKIYSGITITLLNLNITNTSHPQLVYVESFESLSINKTYLSSNDFRSLNNKQVISSLFFIKNVKRCLFVELEVFGIDEILLLDINRVKEMIDIGAAIYYYSESPVSIEISFSMLNSIKGRAIYSNTIELKGLFSAYNLVLINKQQPADVPMQGIVLINIDNIILKEILLQSLGSSESQSSVWVYSDDETPTFITIQNSIFENCESSLGGALSFHGQMNVLVANNEFLMNKAMKKRVSLTKNEVEGVAGAIFYNCSHSSGCKLNITMNKFDSNFAEGYAGIAFCFNKTYSVNNEGNIFFNNSDNKGYSPPIGTSPTSIRVVNIWEDGTDKRLVDLNRTSKIYDSIIIINNGRKINIDMGIFDDFENMCFYDDGSELTLSLNETIEFFSDFKATTKGGIANFNKLMLKGTKGKNYTIYSTKAGFGDLIRNQELPNKFFIRNCLIGELIIEDKGTCSICSDNTYSVLENPEKCQVCPDNSVCSGGSLIIPDIDFWRGSPTSNLIIKCPVKGSCLQVNPNDLVFPNLCYTGHRGPLCTICEPGFSKNTLLKSCQPCARIDFAELMQIIFKILFFVLFTFRAVKTKQSKVSDLNAAEIIQQESIILIFLDHLNQLYLLLSIQGVSESGLDNIFSTLQIGSNVIADQTINIECILFNNSLLDSSYPGSFIKFTTSFAMPFFQIIIVNFVLFLEKVLLFLRKKNIQIYQKFEHLKQEFMPCILVILMNLYTTLVWNFFKVLNCQRLYSSDSKTYLYLDTSVECWSDLHIQFLLKLGIPYTIIWVLGIPVFVLTVFLKQKQGIIGFLKNIREKESKDKEGPSKALISPQSMYFLFFGFKDKKFFWVLIILSWKLVICFLVNFLTGIALFMSLIALYFFLIFLYNFQKPYLFGSMNKYQNNLFLLNLGLIISIGIMTAEASEKDLGLYLFYLALIVNILYNLFAIPYYLKESIKLQSRRISGRISVFKNSINTMKRRRSST